MLIYRKLRMPMFLTTLPFIHRRTNIFAPIEEDLVDLRAYASGDKDVSQSDSHSFTLALDVPNLDEIQRRIERGEYRDLATLSYDVFGWDARDIARLLRHNEDEDEVERRLRDDDFDGDFVKLSDWPDVEWSRVRDSGGDVSVIPFIDAWQRSDSLRQPATRVDSTWHLTSSERFLISKQEQILFEHLQAQQRHRKLPPIKAKTPAPLDTLTASAREEILRLDKYTCFFTGVVSPQAQIDVHHIISRKIIEIIDLPRELFVASFNLIAVESQLNRVKGAKLFRQDVDLYFERFVSSNHRNHQILKYLRQIKALQSGVIE